MKKRIIQKFLGAYIFLILTSVVVLGAFVNLRLREYYQEKIAGELASSAFLIGEVLRDDILSGRVGPIREEAAGLSKRLGLRITVIDGEGKVLADSETDPALMDNHSGREEVARAISGAAGESSRLSDTLEINMKYVALPVRQGGEITGIVRLAVPLTDIERQLGLINRAFIVGGVISVLVTLFIGYFISRRISQPIREMGEIAGSIAKGDFSKRVDITTDDELGDLARSLNRMAGELRQKMENLEKMDRVRTDFVANVSHELKTPLTSIKGFIETLQDGAIDDKENAQKFLEIIRKHAERLGSIINDLLSLTEIENGKVDVKTDRFDIKTLLDEAVWGFGHAVSLKGQKLDVDYNGRDFGVRGNKDKIEQVIVNLIDNAIKYTGRDGHIKVSLFEKRDSIMMTFEDDGIGIDKEHLDRIFERFYRVDKARSRESGGTGLGLSIVKHIVALHNGHIEIESETGKGTKVTVILPR